MAYANFVFGECLGNGGGEFGQLDALSLCCVVAYVASRVEGIVMVPFSHLKTT
jgi:hypothetical protein